MPSLVLVGVDDQRSTLLTVLHLYLFPCSQFENRKVRPFLGVAQQLIKLHLSQLLSYHADLLFHGDAVCIHAFFFRDYFVWLKRAIVRQLLR